MKQPLKSLRAALLFFFICFSSGICFSEAEKRPFAILNNPVNSGFGAIFSSVLSALNLYDQGEYSGIEIDLNEGIFFDSNYGPNWWEYFFEPIRLGDENAPRYVFSMHDVAELVNRGFEMSRERGFELIQKYIHLKPAVEKKVSRFIEKQFENYFIIGIHYRGTDKVLEATPVSYQTVIKHVDWWITNLPKELGVRIFIATDEQRFLDHMKELYPEQVIYNRFVRSTTENPIHYNDHLYSSNYQKGKEALVDCLLLSKCNLLLFPAASAFSMAALKFNPSQIAIPLTGP